MRKTLIIAVFIFLSFGLVFSGSIIVNKPDGTIAWFKGNTYKITWTPSGCQKTDYIINIFKGRTDKAKSKLQLTASGVTFKDWKIPVGFESGTYVIRIKAENKCKGDSKLFEIKSKFAINAGVFKKPLKKPTFKPPKGMFKPVIEEVLDIPLGALKPGTKLYLKGKKFGTNKGKIVVKGNFPGGQFELINVKWESSEKANGVVPPGVNGNPNQTVGVVLVTSYNTKSDPWNMKFEGREEKVLKLGDAVVIQCGEDANINQCNPSTSNPDLKYVAIRGYHWNDSLTIVDNKGQDKYFITLKNGWVFKSIHQLKWKKSSSDEILTGPSPAFPVGKSHWYPVVTWLVTPTDSVEYWIKIMVEGPIGTSYK